MMRRVSLCLLILLFAASGSFAAGITYLVRTGTDSSGNPLFRVADSRDTYLSGLFEITNNSRGLTEAARYYDAVQKDKIAQSLRTSGYSTQQIQSALTNYQTEPVFIEVSNSSSGSYNDWKGSFSVTSSNGQATAYSSPRVVFALGSDAARSGDNSLIEQTLVHEVAHGVMSKAMTASGLPSSPYLSKAHSGGSVTDEQLAFIEGWAEFVGAYFTGRKTIAGDPTDAIDSNWYATRTGTTPSLSELKKTEGWNATVFYHIATTAKDKNALWKMTQVMSATRPQSMTEFLRNVARYYPSLIPTMNQVLYKDSGGQAGAASTQTASTTPRATVNTGSSATTGIQNLYSTYETFVANLKKYVTTGQSTDAQTTANIVSDTQQLESLYLQKQQELKNLPWYRFFEKSRIESDLSVISDLYSRQLAAQQSTMAQAPAQPTNSKAPTAGPIDPAETYGTVLESLQSQDQTSTEKAFKAHQELMERLKIRRGADPKGER